MDNNFETLDIEDVAARFPTAYAAIGYDGYDSLDEMYDESDIIFTVVDGELRCSSHDEFSASAWRDGGWVDIDWDSRKE
jgi:hypothetical protein